MVMHTSFTEGISAGQALTWRFVKGFFIFIIIIPCLSSGSSPLTSVLRDCWISMGRHVWTEARGEAPRVWEICRLMAASPARGISCHLKSFWEEAGREAKLWAGDKNTARGKWLLMKCLGLWLSLHLSLSLHSERTHLLSLLLSYYKSVDSHGLWPVQDWSCEPLSIS